MFILCFCQFGKCSGSLCLESSRSPPDGLRSALWSFKDNPINSFYLSSDFTDFSELALTAFVPGAVTVAAQFSWMIYSLIGLAGAPDATAAGRTRRVKEAGLHLRWMSLAGGGGWLTGKLMRDDGR